MCMVLRLQTQASEMACYVVHIHGLIQYYITADLRSTISALAAGSRPCVDSL